MVVLFKKSNLKYIAFKPFKYNFNLAKRKRYNYLAEKKKIKPSFTSILKKSKWLEFCRLFVWKGFKKSRMNDLELIQDYLKNNLVRWSNIFWILPLDRQYNRSPQLIKQLKSFLYFELPDETDEDEQKIRLIKKEVIFGNDFEDLEDYVDNYNEDEQVFFIWSNKKVRNVKRWCIEKEEWNFNKNQKFIKYYMPVFLGKSFLNKNIRLYFFLETIKKKNFYLFILLKWQLNNLILNNLKFFKIISNFFFQNYSKKKNLSQIIFFFWSNLWLFLKKKHLSFFFSYFYLKLKPFFFKKNVSLFSFLENQIEDDTENLFYISKNFKNLFINKILKKKITVKNYDELYNNFFFIFNKINFLFNDSIFKENFLTEKILSLDYDLKEILLENKRILLISKRYESLCIEELLSDIFKIFEPNEKLIHFRKIIGRGSRRKVLDFYSKFSLNKKKSNYTKKPLHWFKDTVLRDKKYFKIKQKKNKYVVKIAKFKEPLLHRVNCSLKIRILNELNDLIFQKGSLIEKQKTFETLLFSARWVKHYRW